MTWCLVKYKDFTFTITTINRVKVISRLYADSEAMTVKLQCK